MKDPKKKMTLIVFSNDMDKVMASFILATGAASAGMDVTMFFTFWGLALLRAKDHRPKSKQFVEKMFGWMLPKGPGGTQISKMNYLGAGTSMMKGLMRSKKLPLADDFMQMAVSMDVKLIACSTSMGIMGITREELIGGIEVAGVATYLGDATESSVNLFI